MRPLSAPLDTDSAVRADTASPNILDEDIGYEAALPYLLFGASFNADSLRPEMPASAP